MPRRHKWRCCAVLLLIALVNPAHAAGDDVADAFIVRAEAEQFVQTVRAGATANGDQALDVRPLARLLSKKENSEVFAALLSDAQKLPTGSHDDVARSREILRRFFRGRGHAIDPRFCTALGLAAARCEELDCLTRNTKSRDARSLCQATDADLGEGPEERASFPDWVKQRYDADVKVRDQWKPLAAAWGTPGNADFQLPLVAEAQLARIALHQLAPRLVSELKAFKEWQEVGNVTAFLASLSGERDRELGDYNALISAALAALDETTPFGRIFVDAANKRFGEGEVRALRNLTSELTAPARVTAEPDDKSVKDASKRLKDVLLRLNPIVEEQRDNAQKLIDAARSDTEQLAKAPLPREAADDKSACRATSATILPLSTATGRFQIVLAMAAGSGERRSGELFVCDRQAELRGTLTQEAYAGRREVKTELSEGKVPTHGVGAGLFALGIFISGIEEDQGRPVLAPGQRLPNVGVDASTFMSGMVEAARSAAHAELGSRDCQVQQTPAVACTAVLTPVALPSALDITQVSLVAENAPSLSDLSVLVTVRLLRPGIQTSRRIALVKDGQFDLNAFLRSLSDPAAIRVELAKALAENATARTLRLADQLEVRDLTLTEFDRDMIKLGGRLRVGSALDEPISLAIQRGEGGGLRVAVLNDVTGALRRWITPRIDRDRFAGVLKGLLGAGLRAIDLEYLGGMIEILEAGIDPDGGGIFIVLQADLGGGARIQHRATIRPSQLAEDAGRAVEALARSIPADALRDRLKHLLTREFLDQQALEAKLKEPRQIGNVTITAIPSNAFASDRKFSLRFEHANQKVDVHGLRIRGFAPPNDLNIDTSAAQIDPKTQRILGNLLRSALDAELPAGVKAFGAQAGAALDSCGAPLAIPGGRGIRLQFAMRFPFIDCVAMPPVEIGMSGIQADVAQFKESVQQALFKRLEGSVNQLLPDDVRAHVREPRVVPEGNGFHIRAKVSARYLTGNIKVHLTPRLAVKFEVDQEASLQALILAELQKLIPMGGAPVSNIRPLATGIGVLVDVKVKIADLFTAEMKDVRITPKKIALDGLAITIPTPIVIGPFVITHPTIRVSFGPSSTFGLGGRLSFLDLEMIHHVRANLEGRLRERKIVLDGRTFLLEALEVLKDHGEIDFRKGRIELSSESVGVLKVVFPQKQITVLTGDEVTWKNQANLLGLRFNADAVLRLKGRAVGPSEVRTAADKPSLAVTVDASLLGFQRMAGRFFTDLELRRPEADLRSSFKFFGGTAASVHLLANRQRARATATALGLSVSLVVPTLSLLDKGTLEKLLENLLKPHINIEALLDFLKTGKITVSFTAASKGNEFEGDGTNSGQSEAGSSDGPQKQNRGQPPSPSRAEGPSPPKPPGDDWLPSEGNTPGWHKFIARAGADKEFCEHFQFAGGKWTDPLVVSPPFVRPMTIHEGGKPASSLVVTDVEVEVEGALAEECGAKAIPTRTSRIWLNMSWKDGRIAAAPRSPKGAFETLSFSVADLRRVSGRQEFSWVDYDAVGRIAAWTKAPSQFGSFKSIHPFSAKSKSWLGRFDRVTGSSAPAGAIVLALPRFRVLAFSERSALGSIINATIDRGDAASGFRDAIDALIVEWPKVQPTGAGQPHFLFWHEEALVHASDGAILLKRTEEHGDTIIRRLGALGAKPGQSPVRVRLNGTGDFATTPMEGAGASDAIYRTLGRVLATGEFDEVRFNEKQENPVIVLASQLANPKDAKLAFISFDEPGCVRRIANNANLRAALVAVTLPTGPMEKLLSDASSSFADQFAELLQSSRDHWGRMGLIRSPRAAFPVCAEPS